MALFLSSAMWPKKKKKSRRGFYAPGSSIGRYHGRTDGRGRDDTGGGWELPLRDEARRWLAEGKASCPKFAPMSGCPPAFPSISRALVLREQKAIPTSSRRIGGFLHLKSQGEGGLGGTWVSRDSALTPFLVIAASKALSGRVLAPPGDGHRW